MKKLLRLVLPVVAVLVLTLSLSACAMSLTCLSHIDRDRNGKCDNCGTAMVVPREDIESVEVTTLPTKTYYGYNEELDLSGGILTVTFNDGKPAEEIALDDEEISVTLPDMSTAGNKLVRITYGGHKTDFRIEVGVQRFTVIFDLGYDGETIPSQSVPANSLATAPEAPVREGYSFLGWFTDEACTQAFDFALTTITGDITLYAGWTESFTVTYDANYEGGADKTAPTVAGKADSTIVPDEREGYTFIGWYVDEACTQRYDFNTEVTGNITLYAYWISSTAEMFTVTFDQNYEGAPEASTSTVPAGTTVGEPARPTRANVAEKGHQASGFTFGGWYTDAACTTEYDFTRTVTENMTLYAKWTGEYIFEAEHVSLVGPDGLPLKGMGASGGSDGPNMVDSVPDDKLYLNASNGYYVTYLYSPGLAINFNITSDRDVSDAKIVLRVTSENLAYALSPNLNEGTADNGAIYSMYMITLNEQPINYSTIEVDGGWPEFEDFTLVVNASLKKGENVITLMTANNHGMGGTMAGTAPVIDCIKITTSAGLTWDPVTGNEFGQ